MTMAFFSNQGNPFSQAVGTMESTSRRVGLLTAYRNGSLGEACPPCNCPPPPPGGGSGGQSQEESDTSFAFRTPVAWHDGIFQAPKGEVGVPRSYFDGTVGTDPTELPITSVGSMLYLNGQPYTGPLTIRHGASGVGAVAESSEDLKLDASKAPGLVDLKRLIWLLAASPEGKVMGMDASRIPAGWENLPWSVNDGMLIQAILNMSKVVSPEKLKTGSYGAIITDRLSLGSQFYPTPHLLMTFAIALRNAVSEGDWAAYVKSWQSPFFKKLLPFWVEAFNRLPVMAEENKIDDLNTLVAALRGYVDSVTITWPDGTVSRGSGVITKGATTQDERATPVPKPAETPKTNYVLYGGLAALAVGILYFTMKGPSRK